MDWTKEQENKAKEVGFKIIQKYSDIEILLDSGETEKERHYHGYDLMIFSAGEWVKCPLQEVDININA